MTGDLAEWLQEHDLAEYEGLFAENHVDLKTLEILSESDLKELGVPFGPRKRMLKALADSKRQHPSPAETPVVTARVGSPRRQAWM